VKITDEITLDKLSENLRNLPSDFVILVVSPSEIYEKTNAKILKLLCNEEKISGIYITFNQSCETLFELLTGAGVDTSKLFFIDMVTKNVSGKTERTKNCLFIPSPKEISDLGVAIDESIRMSGENKEFLFVDSVSALLLYNSMGTARKFEHFLTIRMRLGSLKGILMSLNSGTEKEIVPFLAQFCDKIIKIK